MIPRNMHIHILGICGTFMGGIAALARAAGHTVTGSDTKVYPPMSTQLAALGIELCEGYLPQHLQPAPDCVVIGNVMSRGNAAVEYLLNANIPYSCGPQWLAEQVLHGQHVLAVAGTHGKTTTASLLAFLLERAGLDPGFLIGGVPRDFGVSARAGTGRYFVVEADEYDSAFFDKRAKFVHYRPRTLVLNNLEYDHADIYPDLAAIERQFHHLIRTVPGAGRLIVNGADANLARVLDMGHWTAVDRFGLDGTENADWQAQLQSADGRRFELFRGGRFVAAIEWTQLGRHNVANALAAIAAAAAVGVPPAASALALAQFQGVKRRLELRAEVNGIAVYDDFAHHPTAIAATLGALRAAVGDARIIALLEPRSNTMRLGVHQDEFAAALAAANQVLLFRPPGLSWDLDRIAQARGNRTQISDSLDSLCADTVRLAQPGDHIVLMSNGSFGGLHTRLIEALAAQPRSATSAAPPGA